MFPSLHKIRNIQFGLKHDVNTTGISPQSCQLYILTANLSTFQQGITYSGISVVNGLPSNIQHLMYDSLRFKNKLHKYCIIKSLYSITEVLLHVGDKL